MKSHRPLTAAVLYVLLGGCSDSAQFNEAAGAKVIQAEPIVFSNPTPTLDPSADGTSPTDPSTGSPSGGSTPADGPTSSIGGSEIASGSTGGSTVGGVAGVGGGTSSTSGIKVGATTPALQSVTENIEKLKLACNSGTKKTLKQSVHFPENQKCNWGINGNLGRRDLYVQAIEGQKATIELPINAQLCDLGIGSAATTIQYDDFMILTLNNQVLLSSNKDLLIGLDESQDQAYVWDFSKPRGKTINFDAASYCLGNSSLCNIPITDVQGSFQFSIDPTVLGKLASNSVNKKNLEFALYATGDDNDRDCWHTAFTLDFTLNYVD